eukprot:CAMPEP_0172450558 /NCGR_PEP_ID=MMETSP1065-20121228/8852_1 /TAXON_ID=265537 /ORGANISM="Amphiprora paludosa, Strain CCMP125" /LENGTH=188 /DNA_ID=CAMNT_0013202351 /DNA_START=406 /DNA_END=972 /DNA_ORIENTATION=-
MATAVTFPQSPHFDRRRVQLAARPPPPRRSYRSSPRRNSDSDDDDGWKVPSGVYIPEDLLDMNFVRSSGAGGQNVNKVNSQAQIRLDLHNPDLFHYVPREVVDRLKEQQANRINKQGSLILQVQEHRTQIQNKKTAMDRLHSFILQAWPRPKVRKLYKSVSPEAKERNKENKRRRSSTKENRKRVDYF